MKHFAALILLTLAVCNGSSREPGSLSLPGEWVMMGDDIEFPLACGSHGPITYTADGKYVLWGETGTWRLEGRSLTEAMTGFDPLHVDRSAEDIGKPEVSTLTWIDPDRFSKRFADGSTREFVRCPPRK